MDRRAAESAEGEAAHGARRSPVRAGALSGPALRRVCLFIHANLDRPLQLRDLAAAARLSRFHFARAFKVATRRTPRQFLLEARVDQAARLLRATDQSLAEVAFACGFSSQSRLTTAFRLAMGSTPARFRRGSGPAIGPVAIVKKCMGVQADWPRDAIRSPEPRAFAT